MKPWHCKTRLKWLIYVQLLPSYVLLQHCGQIEVEVAQTQWLVKCGIIEAASDIVFIIFLRVDWPIRELQNQTWSFLAWNLEDASVGGWKRTSNSGFR